MFRKISYFLLLNIFIVSLFAQHSHGNRGGKKLPAVCEIKGNVVDSTSGFPIGYASITILNHDGEIITGGVSDEDGFFHIREINPGHYDVKIEFMGFKAYEIEE
ncbi:MAG: carboxypeptidase regulatory-like domain-containing protein, partial [Candidatus Marinimicrobia bacterium]|nr:carboxypeptidase regulatory-like domain-containing protein [Candidatus Neomarinimicrobiota bacterium]